MERRFLNRFYKKKLIVLTKIAFLFGIIHVIVMNLQIGHEEIQESYKDTVLLEEIKKRSLSMKFEPYEKAKTKIFGYDYKIIGEDEFKVEDLMPEETFQTYQTKRKNLLRQTCQRSSLTESQNLPNIFVNPHYQSLYISKEIGISFCPVEEAGPNFILKKMVMLGGFKVARVSEIGSHISAIARESFPYLAWDKYPNILSKSKNLIVIRHPFDRLISSYIKVFENSDNSKILKKYAIFIIRLYGSKSRTNSEYGIQRPSFKEFITFLLEQDTLPMLSAWMPISDLCTPCQIPFNTIIEYEHLEQETQRFFESAGLSRTQTRDSVHYWITDVVRRQYFSELSKTDVIELHKKYFADFKTFNYTLENYMSYTTKDDAGLQKANSSVTVIENEKGKNISTSSSTSPNPVIEQNQNEFREDKVHGNDIEDNEAKTQEVDEDESLLKDESETQDEHEHEIQDIEEDENLNKDENESLDEDETQDEETNLYYDDASEEDETKDNEYHDKDIRSRLKMYIDKTKE